MKKNKSRLLNSITFITLAVFSLLFYFINHFYINNQMTYSVLPDTDDRIRSVKETWLFLVFMLHTLFSILLKTQRTKQFVNKHKLFLTIISLLLIVIFILSVFWISNSLYFIYIYYILPQKNVPPAPPGYYIHF